MVRAIRTITRDRFNFAKRCPCLVLSSSIFDSVGESNEEELEPRLLGGHESGFKNRGERPDKKIYEAINKESKVDFWTNPRGLKMCTRSFHPEEKNDKPEALLFFFHGIGAHVHRGFVDSKGNPSNDLLVGRRAAEKGWAAFFLDAEGHGHSEGEFIYVPSHYDCVTDALEYIKHTVSKYPGIAAQIPGLANKPKRRMTNAEICDTCVPWFVMGESWGGNISLNLGLQLQKRPEGVNIDDWSVGAAVSVAYQMVWRLAGCSGSDWRSPSLSCRFHPALLLCPLLPEVDSVLHAKSGFRRSNLERRGGGLILLMSHYHHPHHHHYHPPSYHYHYYHKQ
eukprot:jgi/Bigna1/85446/estExt_fgenesh1_pg.C_40107